MNVNEAKRLVYDLLASYFTGAKTVYSMQSNMVKSASPVVSLTVVSLKRPTNPPTLIVDGLPVGYYPSTLTVQVDLFTKGAAIDVGDGNRVPSENTALGDLVDFINFVGSQYVVDWCHENDIAIAIIGEPKDTTAIGGGSSYQYRATVELSIDFTQKAVGYTGILDPVSIKHHTPEGDASGDDTADDVYVEPEFTPSSSGGGTTDLAEQSTGYFTEAEISETKEET